MAPSSLGGGGGGGGGDGDVCMRCKESQLKYTSIVQTCNIGNCADGTNG